MNHQMRISAARAREQYEMDLVDIKKVTTRINADLVRINSAYQNKQLAYEDYIVRRSSLLTNLQNENQNFINKWPSPPTDYSVSGESFNDTIAAKQNEQVKIGAMIGETNSRIQNHLNSIDQLKAAHRKQISDSNSNGVAIASQEVVSSHVLKALNRFEKFMGSAVNLGYISSDEATRRVRGAEQDASTIREKAPPERKKDYIDNLMAQIKDIIGRKN